MTRRRVAAALAVLLVAATAGATSAQSREVVAPTDLESWYNVSPQAALRGLPPVQPYPPGTLHVGVAAGNEESRTYVTLDLAALSADTPLDTGVLVLPVAPDGGTRNPQSAAFEACLAPDPGPSVSGSLDPPPAIDCSVRAGAVRAPDGTRFTIDLAPFGDRLRDGGLAIVSSVEGRAPGATWHVAFHRNDSEAADAAPITARFAVPPTASSSTGSSSTVPTRTSEALPGRSSAGTDRDPDETIVDLPSQGAAAGSATSGPIAGVAPSGAPPAREERPSSDVAAQPIAPVAAVASGGFRYGAVFGLPLVLLAFVAYFGIALTRDVRPAAPRGPASPAPAPPPD